MSRIVFFCRRLSKLMILFLGIFFQWVGRNARTLYVQARVSRRAIGQGLVEYGLILILIAIVVVGALSMVGSKVSSTYQKINCGVSGGTSQSNNGSGNGNNGNGNNGNGQGNGSSCSAP